MVSTLKLFTAFLVLGSVMSAQEISSPSPVQQDTQTSENPVNKLEPVRPKNYDPLLDLPPLPHNTVSLLGGTITKLDRVRDRIGLLPFGGNETKVAFDVRTKFYRDGAEVKDRELQPGQRIYVDTMLNGQEIFAKNIWIENGASSGRGTGQIIEYDQRHQILKLRGELTAETLQFQLSPKTTIREGNAIRGTNVLVPGSLVSLTFSPAQKNRSLVQEVLIVARPGYTATFFGTVTFLDFSQGFLAIKNRPDGKTYEVHLDGIPRDTLRQLHPGSLIGISAVFDGKQYMAHSLGIASSGNPQ